MRKTKVIAGVICIFVFFGIYLIGLMKLIPIYLAAPPFFLSIFWVIWKANHRNGFRGFNN